MASSTAPKDLSCVGPPLCPPGLATAAAMYGQRGLHSPPHPLLSAIGKQSRREVTAGAGVREGAQLQGNVASFVQVNQKPATDDVACLPVTRTTSLGPLVLQPFQPCLLHALKSSLLQASTAAPGSIATVGL